MLGEDDQLHHVEGSPLPWQPAGLTECGLDAAGVPTWTRAESVAQRKRMGRQRYSLFVCQRCSNAADRHLTWDEDPSSCMGHHASGLRWSSNPERAERFNAELRAIAALVEAHRDEFDEAVDGLLAMASLDELRKAKLARQRRVERTRR